MLHKDHFGLKTKGNLLALTMIFKKFKLTFLLQLTLFILGCNLTSIVLGQTDSSQKLSGPTKDKIEINFNSTDITTLVEIIGKATGISFLYEDTLSQNKKITLLSENSYSIEDAYFIFESVLDINGYTTIKEGPYVRIISKNQARTNQSPILDSIDSDLGQGDFVTMIIPGIIPIIDFATVIFSVVSASLRWII